MVKQTTNNERHTFQDGKLTFKAGGETYRITISSGSWSRDAQTTEVQQDDSLEPTITLNGLRYSGSFSYDGQNPQAINLLMYGSGEAENEPVRGTLSYVEEINNGDVPYDKITFTFKGIIVTGQSRDYTATDASSTSHDWSAEGLNVTVDGGEAPGLDEIL